MKKYYNLVLIWLDKTLAILLSVICLSACGGGHVVKISEIDVQKKFSEQANAPIKLIKIFDVSLSNPVVKLEGVSERLEAQFDVKLFNLATKNSTHGRVAVSGILKYDETKSAVVFSETQVDKVELTDADKNRLINQNAIFVNMLTEKLGGVFLSGIVLRKVDPSELKFGFIKYKLTNIKVADGNLHITLVPSY